MSEYHRQRIINAASFFGWQECGWHECLQDLEAWDACLSQYVKQYQEASADDGVTPDTPLKVRFAMINPEILNEYQHQRNGTTTQGTPSGEFRKFLAIINSNPSALTSGLHFTIGSAPPISLNQLFPPNLTLSPEQRQYLRGQLSVVLDTTITDSSPFTYVKTYPRTYYDSARERMASLFASMASAAGNREYSSRGNAISDDAPVEGGKPVPGVHDHSEVILFNHAGEITEGSVTSVYFFRDGHWVTPLVGPEHGGLPGIGRRWALEHNLCVEQVVRKETVKEGEEIWLSNGVRGFIPGTVVWTKGI
jgi:hypothetical protein